MSDNKPENIQDLLYHFTVLYERWGEDRLAITKQVLKIEQLINDFTTRINELEKATEVTKTGIAKNIYQAARDVSSTVGEETKQAIAQDFDRVTRDFQIAIHTGKENMERFAQKQDEASFVARVLYWLTAIVVAAVVGGLVMKAVMPDPVLPLSKDDLRIYDDGLYFESFWPKLSKREQNRLDDIANGKLVPKLAEQNLVKAKVKHQNREDAKLKDDENNIYVSSGSPNESSSDAEK